MQPDEDANNRYQHSMADARTHVNRSKTRRGIEPPRTVHEQREELVDNSGDHPRRDPLGAVEAQRTRRDNGVGGAWIATGARSYDERDDVFFEKIAEDGRQRTGSDVAQPMPGSDSAGD